MKLNKYVFLWCAAVNMTALGCGETNETVPEESGNTHGECATGKCEPVEGGDGLNEGPSCSNGIMDGDETDADCGAACGIGCGVGEGCKASSDCIAGSECIDNICTIEECSGAFCARGSIELCTDNTMDGDETDVDCGGSCEPCEENKACSTHEDCITGYCRDDRCAVPERAKLSGLHINEVMGAPLVSSRFDIQNETRECEFVEIVNLEDRIVSVKGIKLGFSKNVKSNTGEINKTVELSGIIPAKGVLVVSECEIPMPKDGVNLVLLRSSITNGTDYSIFLYTDEEAGDYVFRRGLQDKEIKGFSQNRDLDLGKTRELKAHDQVSSQGLKNSPGYCSNGFLFSDGCSEEVRSCGETFGSNYVLSQNNGADACGADSINAAQKDGKEASLQLSDGKTCCYVSAILPQNGPNCDSGWVTVSDAEKKICELTFTDNDLESFSELARQEAEGLADKRNDGTDSSDILYCKPGRIAGRYCRYVPEENQSSRVVYQNGQVCTQEQLNPPADSLRIHVMDIGQGDSIWIQTPDNKNVLIDGGDGAAFNTQSAPIITDYLINHGFPSDGKFDAVFLTHPHSDHFGGFISLFGTKSTFGIKNYIDPMELDTNQYVASNYVKWINRVKAIVPAANIYMPAEEKFKVGGSFPKSFFGSEVKTEFLYSNKQTGAKQSSANLNSASIIFRLSYKGYSMLFTGDAEAAQENKAIATGRVKSNFLKVCHHGSTTSSSPEFLKAIWNTPKENANGETRGAFISSGRRMFSGSYIPDDVSILPRLKQYLYDNQIFSTSAGDDWKHESQSYRDDNILIVIKDENDYYACYEGTN